MNSGINKVAEKIVPKLTSKISAIKKGLGEIVAGLKKAADSSIFRSKYISNKIAQKQVNKLLSDNADELLDKSLKQLPPDILEDVNGQKMTKEALKRIARDEKDGTVLGYIKYADETIQIVKNNKMLGIKFDPSKYHTVTIPGELTSDRNGNFLKAAEQLKEKLLKNPAKIPESLAVALRNKGVDLEELMPRDLVSIIRRSDMVLHENADKLTVSLVPRAVHKHVSHMGGVSLAKYVESGLGAEHFDKLIPDQITGAVAPAY